MLAREPMIFGKPVPNAILAYSALSRENKVRFLSRIAHELTGRARDAYETTTSDPQKTAQLLTAYNELGHKIIGEMIHHLEAHHFRYPDDVFVRIIFDMAEPAECGGWVE